MSELQLKKFRRRGLGPIDFTIQRGECVALSGPSGSGKTLLLRAIADLDTHEGDARVDGENQQSMTGPAWRRQVGFLPAESHWWYEQVRDHFRNGVEHLLTKLDLPAESLNWEVHRLSSGERQRLALARLLAGGPSVLLLDEVTANLDPENTARVERIVEEYRQQEGAAVLWVSHDRLQRARIAGRSYLIRGNRLEDER